MKKSLARRISESLERSAKKSVGVQKTFLGSQKVPTELAKGNKQG